VLKRPARPPASPQQTAPPRQTGSPRQTASPRPVASARQLAPYQRHNAARSAQPTAPGSAFQRAFIEQVAPGAIATQQKYGVPASVTIAQAIDESAWGQSILATHDHNLFGIKGTGPAGSDLLPTREFAGGQLVDTTAPFRIYHDMGQSIEAHGKLLARSDYFTNAMANRHQPNAFAAALTGVYATDPGYGTKLIQLMQQYNLYRFDVAARAHRASPAARGGAEIPGVTGRFRAARLRPGGSRGRQARTRTPPESGTRIAAWTEPRIGARRRSGARRSWCRGSAGSAPGLRGCRLGN
jgi:flagellum-specific peptidoglycan hydrolase FlgJ